VGVLDRAIRLLEEANAALAAAVISGSDAQRLLSRYVRVERLAGFGTSTLAARVGDAKRLAKQSGVSVGQARRVIDTGRVVAGSAVLSEAMQCGAVSVVQADVIARTAVVAPGAVEELVAVARDESFQVLKDAARRARVAAVDRSTLGERQRAARRLRHWVGELGMVHVDAVLEPHVGARIVSRLEDEAKRLARAAGNREPLERFLADALDRVTSGAGTSRGKTELVVVVSHEVTRRGWTDVTDGEVCKVPGIGPVAAEVAKEIASDAFLSGVVFDGTDLRQMRRWTRHIPAAVRVALSLGEPPGFDGPKCVDCGRRLNLEVDHLVPVAAGGDTSVSNSGWRCDDCHDDKTATDLADLARDRRRRHNPAVPPHAPPLPLPP